MERAPGANRTVIPSNQRELYRVTAVAGAAGFLFGYDTAVINGALVFLRLGFHLSESQTEWTASSLLWGCLVGALFTGSLSDKYGRKRMLLLSGIVFFVSALISAFPPSLSVLIGARVLGGLGIGIASTLAPVYLAELAPSEQRGRIVTINQLAIVSGILVAYGVSWGFSFLGASSWRWMFGSAALPALAFALATMSIPESPRWLLEKGRQAQAAVVLQKLGAEDVALQIERITTSTAYEREAGTISFRHLWKPLALAIALAIMQQVTGINTVLYYGAILFQEHAGIGSNGAVGANVLIGIVNFAFTLVAMGIVDRLPRRLLLGGSALIMGISLAGLSISFRAATVSFPIVISSILLYVAAFAVGLGPGVWLYNSELFPTAIRGRAMSIATAALWGACIAVTNTYLTAIRLLSVSGVFLFYAAMCAVMCIFSFVLPETRGRSLESISDDW